MAKKLKDEIKTFLDNNTELSEKIKQIENIEKVYKCIPNKILKGIKQIDIKDNNIIIKTNTPSWKQEIYFLKKEIMKKIDKNFRNYSDLKITIL
jgi:hypothetical protein